MDLSLNGIKVSVSEAEIAALLRERLLGQAVPARTESTAPVIAAELGGAIYAGITLHEGKPHNLYLLPGEREKIDWKDAGAWAEQQGGTLPSRIDQLVLWQNLKAQFKPEWYWSCEPYAGNEDRYAWSQNFYDGYQLSTNESSLLRARAVRRIAI
jgi:hypothetical protein